jgi:hypothetical protein
MLSLQETLIGCKSEMPGNLIFLETIFSIIDVGLDQDEYLRVGLCLKDCLEISNITRPSKNVIRQGLIKENRR